MSKIESFISLVKRYYLDHKRALVWRDQITPYGVFVSEVMLQQTQVPRVMVKFPEFTSRFPDFTSLAASPVKDVLAAWQGLGYNRRGLYLKRAAEIVTEQYRGILPENPVLIDELPGIGPATAASIVTYTYNKPTIFIETNVRRVYIHHFFSDSQEVSDAQLYPFVAETVDQENPREWYYALMDYGTYLAKTVPNPNRRSKHYVKQSAFEGSMRQIRGMILKLLITQPALTEQNIVDSIQKEPEKVRTILFDMVKEGFLVQEKRSFRLSE
jgi:A/G-specific adenine glycosylase